ncbi:helicase C-terminal domain-containing protein [Larsenimonas salina]|uniref:helicase C-terminal domain-containing protein n=1 Tax=Larsenimonas salina TaxID=1295565 RepID=UPI002073D1DA|nr:helicase C-terminal domain-containing protein [Larsenimonas salina]MCM5704206.1 ATP-dependent DNA helicase [Larsenimonas salina]
MSGSGESLSLRVGVRTLCAFGARSGDIDLRFTPSPTALEGILGHQRVAGRRPDSFEAEVTLRAEIDGLEVVGRCDGVDMQGVDGPEVQEIKTHRGRLDQQPANQRALHWAQARVYGALLCRARALPRIVLALVYVDITSDDETRLSETATRDELETFLKALCGRYLEWGRLEQQHRKRRDEALSRLAFPFDEFRPAQRPLAESVYKSVMLSRHALLEAPTGLGKTLGTLFPMLKAMPNRPLDRVFFLTARTTGRQLALDGLEALASNTHPPVRVLELIARSKACEHPDKACHGESCPLARGFYDRLPAAREAAADTGWLDGASLRALAHSHEVCPYYLGQEMARWSDVIVGDVSYYFDFSAMLFALSCEQKWQVGVLVDEAHNLIERARGMYSAELDQTRLRAVRREAPKPVQRGLDRIQRAWRALNAERLDDASNKAPVTLETVPEALEGALKRFVSIMSETLSEAPIPIQSALLDCYFEVLHFLRVLEVSDEAHFLLDVRPGALRRQGVDSRLALRNVVPAPMLAPRFASAASTILFSATLSPSTYYRRLLGLESDVAYQRLPSPFSSEQLEVVIHRRLSTRYRDRAAALPDIATLMRDQYRARPGNYLAFFSSYAFLEQARAALTSLDPGLEIWAQDTGMSEAARTKFLARFESGGQGIGFAVLGGAFAEGVDLPGDRLIGAFIATLGLPQFDAVNERMRERISQAGGQGYEDVYLYPGLTRVVQAAGRVIRGPLDTGVVHLMDDRFARPDVQALLPEWWSVSFS